MGREGGGRQGEVAGVEEDGDEGGEDGIDGTHFLGGDVLKGVFVGGVVFFLLVCFGFSERRLGGLIFLV